MHYIIENDKQEVIAWGVMFEKEDELRFSILVLRKYKLDKYITAQLIKY